MRQLVTLTAAAAFVVAFGFGGVQTVYAEPSDLVSVWQFDEDADEFGTARDAVDDNDGTVNGAVSTESGAFGRALDFDGSNDFVVVPSNANLEPPNFTIEAKIKILDNSGFNRIAVKTQTALARQSYSLAVDSSGKVELRMERLGGGGTDLVVSASTVDDGVFHHVAGTFDGTDLRIYVDGFLENTVTSTEAVPAYDGGDFFIGSFNGSIEFFDGVIDELRFWDSALSDGEVAASAELEEIVVDQITAGDNRIKPGVEEILVNGTPILVFFTASIYDVAGAPDDVVVCISPDLTVADVDIQISPTNAFSTRGRTFTPKPAGSSFNETESDDSTSDFTPAGECATIEDIIFATKTKTLHLNLNLVDADTDAPGTSGTGTIVDSVGINVQKNPLGG